MAATDEDGMNVRELEIEFPGLGWANQNIYTMSDLDLSWNCIIPGEREYNSQTDRGGVRAMQTCLFCRAEWKGGSPGRQIISHMDPGEKRHRKVCKPTRYLNRFKKVQAEIISRRHARIAAAEAEQRLEQAERRAQTDTHPHNIQQGQLPRETPRSAVTPDEVNAAWARAFAANAISFCAVDDEHFREAVKLTAECGQDYLNPQHESRLPHRTSFVTKTIKNEGNSVADTVDTSVTTAADTSGGTLLSDGSKSKSKKALINILFNTEAGTQSLCTVPATEVVKDMRYIANLLIERIIAIGADKVTAICMDGACFGCFKFIQQRFPHIHCYICPTHSLDNFIKNICSKKPFITIRGQGSFEWGESIFYNAIQKVKTVVRSVCGHQYALDVFRRIKDRENKQLPHGAEKYKDLMKFCRTRFLSQVLMVIRFDLNLPVLNIMMHDRGFLNWLSRQSAKTQNKVDISIRQS